MMLDWMKKRKWLALVMVMCMILTILPTDFSWADNVIGVNTEESTQSSSSESDGGITEVTTEALTEGTEDLSSEGTEDVSKVTEDVSKVTEAVSKETETASSEEAEPALLKSSETATEADQSELPVVGEETKEDILGASEMMIKQDGTSNFQLTKLELSASYKDKNNETHIVEMNTTEGVTLPDNATISLNFDFLMYNGNTVEVGKEYIYKIPSDIRIDVNETLELITNDKKSIGTVKIDQANRQLVFVFNHNVDNQVNIPFYVRFAGGLSADVEEEAKDVEISFATATGHFDYNVKIEDSYNKPTPTEPGDLEMTKSGNKVTIDGKQYIEWNLSLNLNGRDSLNAEISDMLPEGLTYAEDVAGYPKVEGTKYGQTPSISTVVNENMVSFNVSNVTADYRANVKFLTTYNSNIFPDKITENSSATVANTAAIQEEGTNTPVYGTGNAVVTPKLLSKSGSVKENGTIEWTVVINSDKMDLGNATYQDEFGEGISWPGGSYDASDITISPSSAGTISNTTNGFTFTPAEGYKNQEITLTYKTQMDNVMLDQYENTGKLTGTKYNVTSKATVPGFDLFEKQNVSYNEVTKQLTWKIIVNKDKQSVFGNNEVTITDIFNPQGIKQNEMELKKMEITNATGTSSLSDFDSYSADLTNGTITVPGDKLNGTTLEITVVTHILDEKNLNATYDPNWEDKWKDGDWVSATNNATLAWNSQTIPASSNKGFQYKAPDLITKTGSQPKYNDGSVKGDGTIEWTLLVTTFQEDTKTNKIVLTDTLPEGTKYVPGSLYMNKRWDGTKYSMEPTISGDGKTLSLTLDRTNGNVAACLDERNYFEIHYKTVVTDKDKAKADTSYTNQAEVTVNYEGDATVTDKDEDTVSGVLGGELRKEAIYQSGKNYVDWEVAINEGRFNMSSVTNPVIRDKLADYLQYVENSGTLYKVAENGNRTEVTSGFLVNVINNEMVVALPKIGSDMYVFAFQTKFTVSQAQAATLDFSNDISFSGTGQSQSVSSNKVKNVSFSSSSAGAYHENELRLVKVDSNNKKKLAGAVFELKDSNGNVLARETSGTDGVAVFKGVKLSTEGYTYTVKEVTSPEGYKISTADIPISVSEWKTDSNGIRYYEKEIPNTPKTQTTTFSLVKTSSKDGKMLAGAEFSVYSASTCADDKLVNSKKTDTTGQVTFDVEYSSTAATTYYVKETKTPDGYAKPSTDEYYEVTIGTNGDVTGVKKYTAPSTSTDVTVTDKSFTVTNTPVHGSFKITKVKEGTTDGLQGARFTIYKDKQCSDDVSTQTTNTDGTVTFDNLEIGRTYYYKEVEAPEGYILDGTVYSVTIDDASKRDPDGTIHQSVEVTKTLENKLALGAVKIKKTDNGVPAKALRGAEFTLYSVGAGGETEYKIPSSGGSSEAYKVTTDDNGEAVFKDLPFGNYVIKETNVPTGYKASVTNGKTPVTIDTVDTKNVTIINDVITFTLKIKKVDDGGNKLPGAYFEVRNSQGVRVAQGETSDDGTLTFEDLPYDTYTIKETRGVAGYTMDANSQTVAKADITTNGMTIEKTFTNVKQQGKITFTKKDSDGSSGLQNAEFSLYKDDGTGKPGEFVKKAVSDDSGKVTFQDLAFGKYVIKETKAPANYQINTDTWTVTVNSNTEITQVYSVSASGNTGDITDVKIPSGQNYMHFTLRKADEKGQPIKGAQFTLTKNFADPLNYGTSADNGAPKTYTAYSDDSGVVSFIDVYIEKDPDTTTYTLEETGVPYGYTSSKTVIFDKMSKDEMIRKAYTTTYSSTSTDPSKDYNENNVVDITNAVGYTNLVENASGNNCIKNQQIKGSFLITKKASGSLNTFLQGAEFTLYKLNPENNTYEKYQPAGYANPKTTDAKGLLSFGDLVLGKYRVVETKAPAGYILNTANQKDFEVTEANYNKTKELSVTISNAPYSISVSKYAVGGSTQLKGAKLGLYKASDTSYANCLENWDTTNNPYKIPATKLEAGIEYVIHELKAPAGYCVSPEDVKFKVNTNGTVTYTGLAGSQYGSASSTNVILRDKKISLYIDKRGVDTTGGSSTDIALSGASISILDNATNKVVVTFTSTTSKYEVPMGVLTGPSGTADYHKYTIRENSAPGGYAMAEDIVIAIDKEGNIHKVNADGSVSTNTWADNTVEMVDTKYKNFYFAKRDKTTGDALVGARFGIYKADVWEANKDRTTNTSYATDAGTGASLSWNSTAVPKNVSLAIDEYYFVELEAPAGYELEEPIKFKVVDTNTDSTGDKIEIIGEAPNSNLSASQLMLTSRDSAIEVRFVKWSKSLQPLTGGKFSVHASDNKKTVGAKIGESFSAEGSAITLDSSYFELGKYYAIVEEQAPVGYTVTSPQFFQIGMDGKVYDLDGNPIDNHLLIFIDELNPICINKVDAETGAPIPGVELTISSENPRFQDITWVTDGTNKYLALTDFTEGETYTLTETKTVNGYAYADSITFKYTTGTKDELYVNGVKMNTMNIMMEDEPITMSVDKFILGTTKHLAGAALQVVDDGGNVVESWTTDDTTHVLDASKYMASKTPGEHMYKLMEVSAPELYARAPEIEFYINRDGQVCLSDDTPVAENNLVMYDDFLGVAISKQDFAGNEIPGAKLTITSKEDGTFTPITWVSTTTPYNIDREKFKPGVTYTLTETAAPNGYAYAESIDFMVDEDGNVLVNGKPVTDKTIVMVDGVLTLNLAKKVEGSDRYLAGATFGVYEVATGKQLFTFTSKDGLTEMDTKLLRTSHGEESVFYLLRELEAPVGFELAPDTYFYFDEKGALYVLNEDKTVFALAADQTITVFDAPSTTSSKKTGDVSPIRALGMMFFLSLAGLGSIMAMKRLKIK